MFTKIGFFAFLCCVSLGVAFEQYASFFVDPKFEGDSYTFKSKQSDITNITNFIMNCRSYKIRGYWRAYTAPNFDGGNLFIFNVESEYSNPDRISEVMYFSIRHAGPRDTSEKSISFYLYNELNGEEKTITGAESNDIPFTPQSIFSTGFSNWTLFSGENFDGDATCYTSTAENHYLPTLSPVLSNVRSIRAGCPEHVKSFVYPKDFSSNLANKIMFK